MRNRARIEAIAWALAFALLYGGAIAYDWHEALDAWAETHEQWELDEIITAFAIAGVLGLLYSILRIKDLSREIGRRQLAEKEVDWIACHDPLTRLPNRRHLEAQWPDAAENDEPRGKFAIFSIDLDGFKTVNDLLGHSYGDAVLKATADRLAAVFPDEHVYRLGGDEFLVITRRIGKPDLETIGQRIIRNIAKPVEVSCSVVEVGASIGYALYPEDAPDMPTGMQLADCAMYAAKRSGRNKVRAFIPSMQDELLKRNVMEMEIRQALRNGDIVPYYQPLVDLHSQAVVGFEALARWQKAPGKFVPPSEFIPIAEDAGMIVELTEQLFHRACSDALTWPENTFLSFNISPVQLSDRLLGQRIMKIINEIGLPVHRLELEITESALVKDAVAARGTLDELVAAGIKIALDDFGTGYSSLSQLSSFQFDKIKIDRSFVQSFETSEKQDKVVKAIIALGAGLGVKITAEGIEDESQLHRLQQLGCDIGQGYLFGKATAAACFDLAGPDSSGPRNGLKAS